MKQLVIAEKPSVASDIARALGGFTKHDDYFENDHYVIASAVGHLVELIVPDEHDIKRGKWTFEHMPHLPPAFGLKPVDRSLAKLKTIAKLVKRKDVTGLINACDAGREGELIFRNIVTYTKAKQPVKRLWLQSMTQDAIRDGFQHLRTDEQMQPLADAAVSRSESDWLVGINSTRALTAFNSRGGGFQKTTAGRVQTPTLAIVVAREKQIRAFTSRDYWEVHAVFGAQAGTYPGRWFDEKFNKEAPEVKRDAEIKAERLWKKSEAERIQAKCEGKPGIVEKEEKKPASQLSPLLYDLTSLQRDANGRFGFPARRTLQIAQSLYEKHKVLTYPRTDSRYLPEDYIGTVRGTLGMLKHSALGKFADQIIDSGWLKPTKRVFNNAKVSDHFAIIPTQQPPKNLDESEQKLYDLVVKRFLAVFFPAAQFEETTRITRVEGEPFLTKGKVLKEPGWLAIYGKEAQSEKKEDDESPSLVAVTNQEMVSTNEISIKDLKTKPPARYNEATLLSAMEGAGKQIEDEELRDAMAQRGLGTPATRAAIIEGLLTEEYLRREGRDLHATPKAVALIDLLDVLKIPTLRSPEMTAEWEFKLKQMEGRDLSRSAFMTEIRDLTTKIVNTIKQCDESTISANPVAFKSPTGAPMVEALRDYRSEDGTFKMRKNIAGRFLAHEEAEELIRNKTIGPLHGFRSKMGRPFSAVLKLADTGEVNFDFGNDAPVGEDGQPLPPPDFSGHETLGKCPKCGAPVFAHGVRYVCEKSLAQPKTCDFATGSVILQQQIDRAQVTKLLETGKTDLLEGFVSNKTNRKFKAYLALGKDGKVGFEFAPREGGAGKGKGRDAKPAEKFDFTGQEPVGKCPKCKANVYETPEAYVCEKGQADSKRCTFRFARLLCQRVILREEAATLLKSRKTDTITDFVSKGGRPFAAQLVVDKKGKVGFEFSAE